VDTFEKGSYGFNFYYQTVVFDIETYKPFGTVFEFVKVLCIVGIW